MNKTPRNISMTLIGVTATFCRLPKPEMVKQKSGPPKPKQSITLLLEPGAQLTQLKEHVANMASDMELNLERDADKIALKDGNLCIGRKSGKVYAGHENRWALKCTVGKLTRYDEDGNVLVINGVPQEGMEPKLLTPSKKRIPSLYCPHDWAQEGLRIATPAEFINYLPYDGCKVNAIIRLYKNSEYGRIGCSPSVIQFAGDGERLNPDSEDELPEMNDIDASTDAYAPIAEDDY